MALTNKGLREILSTAGVDTEHMTPAVTAIMEGHNATVEALKEERDTARGDVAKYKPDAEKLPGVQAELDTLRAAKWEEKYNTEHTALEALKAENAVKESRAAKDKAVRDYLKDKGISDKAMDAAALAAASVLDGLELKKDGTIKDAAALDSLISGPLASLVSTTSTIPGEDPPVMNGVPAGSGSVYKTVDDIYKIEDAAERQAAINSNPGLFGYGQ